MPFVPNGEFVTSAWFCAGVPIGGPQLGGVAVVANPSEVALTGKITTFTDAAGVACGRRRRSRFRPGGPACSISPRCSRRARSSRRWSRSTAVADSSSSAPTAPRAVRCRRAPTRRRRPGTSPTGTRSRAAGNNWSSPTRSRPTRSSASANPPHREPQAGDPAEPAGEGQLRAGHQPGPARQARARSWRSPSPAPVAGSSSAARRSTSPRSAAPGFTMTLGAPSLGEQFYFADGEVGAQRGRRALQHLQRRPTPRPWSTWRSSGSIRRSASSTPSRSPCRPGKVASLIAGDVGVPAGRHGAVFSTETAGSILVERAITRTDRATPCATTVVMGSPPAFASTAGAWRSAPTWPSTTCSSS